MGWNENKHMYDFLFKGNGDPRRGLKLQFVELDTNDDQKLLCITFNDIA